MTEVNKYLSLTNHTYNALAVLVSKQSFDRLSDEEQQKVREAAKVAIDRQRAQAIKNEEGTIEKIKETGMEVNEIDDLSIFREQVSEIYDEYRDTIGAEVVDAALAEVQG